MTFQNNAPNIITVKNLSKSFNDLKVLNNLSFDVKEGEIISIIGPSGCGKTTLLKVLGNLVNDLNSPIVLKNSLGFVFQKPFLLPWKSVEQHINFPLKINKIEDSNRVEELIGLVGLKGFEKYYPNQISGGMQQRLAIAMSLSYNPDILLMDEPFSSLDEITRNNLQEELLRIFYHKNSSVKSILYVTHSIEEAVFLSDKVIILSEKPSIIKGIIEINLQRPRKVSVKGSKQFFDYTNKLRSILK